MPLVVPSLILPDGYRQEVLADSPHCYYRMDDAGGTMADASGNGRNGTHSNSPTLAQAGALLNDPNTAVKYDGTNDFSSVTLDLTAYSHLSVECWLYWTAFGTDDKLAYEFGNPAYASVNRNGFVLDPNGSTTDNTKAAFGFGGGSSGAGWQDGFPRPSANAWHHYVIEIDRSAVANVAAYVDGVAQTLTTLFHNAGSKGATFGNQPLYLMSRTGSALLCPANSMIDEFAIYGNATGTAPLPAARVKAHYSAATRRDSGLIVPQAVMRASSW